MRQLLLGYKTGAIEKSQILDIGMETEMRGVHQMITEEEITTKADFKDSGFKQLGHKPLFLVWGSLREA
jgi:hypothetical protein